MTTRVGSALAALVGAPAAALLIGCATPHPTPIAYGEAPCDHCHMIVADPRFAAELVTVKGRVYTFDDVACLTAFLHDSTVPGADVHSLWVSDYLHPDSLLDATTAVYVRDASLRTPMGGNLAATSPGPDAERLQRERTGTVLRWDDVLALSGGHPGTPIAVETTGAAAAR